MHNKSVKQRIIALILCFIMLFGLVHIENFINNDISAAGDGSMENIEFGGTGTQTTTNWSYNFLDKYIVVTWDGHPEYTETIYANEERAENCFTFDENTGAMVVYEGLLNKHLYYNLGWPLDTYYGTIRWKSDVKIRLSLEILDGDNSTLYECDYNTPVDTGISGVYQDSYGIRLVYDSLRNFKTYNGKSVSVPAGIQAIDYEADGGGFYFVLQDSNGVKGFFSHSFGFGGHDSAVLEEGYYELSDPIDFGNGETPDPNPAIPESNGEEVFRSKLWIDPAISNSINDNGVGVIGNWNSYTSKTCVCGGNSTSSQLIEFYEKIPESEFDGYTEWETDDHDWVTEPTYEYTEPTYYPQETDPETGELLPLEMENEGYYEQWASYYTWAEDYCDRYATHNIGNPSIINYTLTLHYQGGYYNGGGDTYSMNGTPTQYNFDSARNGANVTDLVTSETTKVYCSAKTLDGPGNWDGSTYTHPNADYVEATITFSYSNYYIVTLPTPQREGFRFIGWFTASSGGSQVTPTTVNGFSNAYVIRANTTLYAQWELITKDETFTIYWMDNSNNYTTRPEAVYVELYRISGTSSELCETYITESLTTENPGYMQNFYNNTKGSKVDTFDPNVYLDSSGTLNSNNNIFEFNGTYLIKITGDNIVPAGSNSWSITLQNLQMYDCSKSGWIEYEYVIKEVIVESLDKTTQYYVSPNVLHNNYSTSLNKYYNIENNNDNNSGQGTLNQYNNLGIETDFSHVIVNRLANNSDTSAWKEIVISTTFKDGPNDGISNDDIYHFRPYDLKLELYQNYAGSINTSKNNDLLDTGVRIIYDNSDTDEVEGIKSITQYLNPLSSTIPSSGTMANTLIYTFTNVPTLQDATCIKIAYDVILTHEQSRYRYTIDSSDPYNNLDDKYASSHYYANKHETITNTVLDLDYTKMIKDGNIITVSPDEAEIYNSQGYKFVDADLSNIFQDYQKQEDDDLYLVGQNNIYEIYGTTVGTITYPDAYKSMAYNIRYYYISEGRDMDADIDYKILPNNMVENKQTAYLFYKETLYWNFTLTLNDDRTPLPEEYTGSASSDDRTGNYNGNTNDDFIHTNNVLTITSIVYSNDNQTVIANDSNYDKLLMNIPEEGFLITLKQVEKIWNYSGYSTSEAYNNNKYSTNGYMHVNNTSTGTTVTFKSNTAVATNAIAVGNEYNVYVPANGSTTLNYLPDGKYEITCHYDIDFNNFNFSLANGNVVFSIENGKAYVTLSSKDVATTGNINHAATIDYWRGYVNDENQIPSYGTSVKYSVWNEKHGGSLNGFNEYTNMDEKDPNSFYGDYIDENYKSYQ